MSRAIHVLSLYDLVVFCITEHYARVYKLMYIHAQAQEATANAVFMIWLLAW